MFFMSCEILFGYNNGDEWGLSHYRFKKQNNSDPTSDFKWEYILITQNNVKFKEFLEKIEDSKSISLIDLKGDYSYLSERFLEYNSLTSSKYSNCEQF